MRTPIAIALLLVAAAAPPAALRPGLWQVTSVPTGASLDGHPLGDLPYTPPTAPEQVCLSATDARDTAAWLARDVARGCTLTRRSIAGRRIALAGTCPPQAEGLARGTVRLTGTWSRDRYRLRFSTENPSENGRMGFTGTVEAHRVGECPATPARPS